jgi:hypothetical protein
MLLKHGKQSANCAVDCGAEQVRGVSLQQRKPWPSSESHNVIIERFSIPVRPSASHPRRWVHCGFADWSVSRVSIASQATACPADPSLLPRLDLERPSAVSCRVSSRAQAPNCFTQRTPSDTEYRYCSEKARERAVADPCRKRTYRESKSGEELLCSCCVEEQRKRSGKHQVVRRVRGKEHLILAV